MLKSQTVFVGMSGGVDSSLSALLLKEQGYHVVGAYMKNWSKDLPGMHCPWAEDLADAKRVATKLGIDFLVFDFEKGYKAKVVDYMLSEFQAGRTPNPDIMCNQEIKFKLFFDIAMEHGADFIATGHYANTKDGKLLTAKDQNKDQTYFLYRVESDALSKTLFPLGDMLKSDVKKAAEENGLHNAYKKESMGVCFVGEVGIHDFLQEYFETKFGDIIDIDTNKNIGMHDGAIFYTIGQRHGLDIGLDLPYYVVDKNIEKNIVYVSKNINHSKLWTNTLKLRDLFLREKLKDGDKILVRLRHRAALISAIFSYDAASSPSSSSLLSSSPSLSHPPSVPSAQSTPTLASISSVSSSHLYARITFDNQIKTIASGQSAVFYQDSVCLGGGIII